MLGGNDRPRSGLFFATIPKRRSHCATLKIKPTEKAYEPVTYRAGLRMKPHAVKRRPRRAPDDRTMPNKKPRLLQY